MRNAAYDSDPAAYDKLRSGWLNRRRAAHFHAVVREYEPGTVLELGCGTGRMLSDLARAWPATRFIGVEPLTGYVEYGREHAAASGLANLDLRCGTGERLVEAMDGELADIVISSDVLHHVDSIPAVVDSVKAITRRGGSWALVEPSATNPYVFAYQALTRGERNFRSSAFLRTARRAGWSIAQRSHLFLIPAAVDRPPEWLIAAERRLERLPGLGGAIALELRANGRA